MRTHGLRFATYLGLWSIGCGTDPRTDCSQLLNACDPLGATRCHGNAVQTCSEAENQCPIWNKPADCSPAETCTEQAGIASCGAACGECPVEGQRRCAGTLIETCVQGQDGCRNWTKLADCATGGKTCTEEAGSVACTCPVGCTEGESRCLGDVIETCSQNTNGCLAWTAGQDCRAAGQTCRVEAEAATCTCEDACTQGETRCQGNAVESCAANASGCLVWTAGEDCTDSGKTCTPEAGAATCTCPAGCAENATRCAGTVVETCALGGNGCRSWAPAEDCAVQNKVCELQEESAVCADTCADSCPAVGDTRCNGSVIETCTTQGACLAWAAGQDCADTEQVCDASGGLPICTDLCESTCQSLGAGRCQETVVETCTDVGQGCLQWRSGSDCSATGQLCEVNGTAAACVCAPSCSPAGAARCNNEVIETCVPLSAPSVCLAWEQTTDCAAQGRHCDDSGSTPACVCEASCPTAGATRCQASVIETCTVVQSSGCQAFVAGQDCAPDRICNDRDGSAECVDSLPGDTCGDPIEIPSLPFRIAGANFAQDFRDDINFSGQTDCSVLRQGPELVLQIDLTAGQSIRFIERGSMDEMVRVTDSCSPPIACLFESTTTDQNGNPIPRTFQAGPAGTYFVSLEAGLATGAYDFTVEAVSGLACTDNPDDDLDGATDCAGPDCFGAAHGNPEADPQHVGIANGATGGSLPPETNFR